MFIPKSLYNNTESLYVINIILLTLVTNVNYNRGKLFAALFTSLLNVSMIIMYILHILKNNNMENNEPEINYFYDRSYQWFY